MLQDYIEICRVLKTRGLKGEIKVMPYSDFPEGLCDFDILHIQSQPLQFEPREVLKCSPSGTTAFLMLEGIDSREDAQQLVGNDLFIKRAQMHQLAEGKYYQRDLLDCVVHSIDGDKLGIVRDLMDVPSGCLLVVGLSNPSPERSDDEVLIPFKPEFISAVDLDRRIITVDLPTGLI
ncbi:MAG: 16S rRNA processing protein RimM [Candidatus Delongbacteria bacterium]|nr:16S rRNA processing protein RimM [Candidatus Delongbacteria bacterium]